MRSEPLECGAVQGFAVVGMGDGDEEPGTFLEGFAIEVHGAVLGDDPLHIGAGRDDAGAGLQRGDDLGGEFRRPGSQGDEALPPSDILAPRTKSSCPPVPE